MIIRKTEPVELPTVMRIYDEGREYMRKNGNLDQWINGFPQESLIAADIANGISYLVADEDGKILAVFAFLEGPDPSYANIFDGAWPDDRPYHVIHRIAVTAHRRGVASYIYDWALQHCDSLRIDTHENNIPMRNSLKKNGFQYCGKIIIDDGTERLAFQKKAVREENQ